MTYFINYETISPAVLALIIERACPIAYCRWEEVDEEGFWLSICWWEEPGCHELCLVEKALAPYV